MRKIYSLTGKCLSILLLPALHFYGKLARKPRVRAFIYHDNKVLLVKNWLGEQKWTLPGGGIKKSESSRRALCREIEEELTIKLQEDDLIYIGEVCDTSSAPFNARCYFIEVSSLSHFKISHELLDARWFPLDRLPKKHSMVLGACMALSPFEKSTK